ncbi:MAG: protein dpnD [Tissierellia bacterium]|nr:protein dpnD [Tissierellia bacterium]
MKTYEFEIIETLQKIVSVSANNEREAYNKVFNMYTNGEVTLDAEDFLETEINYIGSDNY